MSWKVTNLQLAQITRQLLLCFFPSEYLSKSLQGSYAWTFVVYSVVTSPIHPCFLLTVKITYWSQQLIRDWKNDSKHLVDTRSVILLLWFVLKSFLIHMIKRHLPKLKTSVSSNLNRTLYFWLRVKLDSAQKITNKSTWFVMLFVKSLRKPVQNNGHRPWNWNRWYEIKSWMSLYMFLFALIPSPKAWINHSSPNNE